MALGTIRQLVGFETGGNEELTTVVGVVDVQNTVVKTGGYAAKLVSGADNRFTIGQATGSGTTAIQRFDVYFTDVTPGTSYSFFRNGSASGYNLFFEATTGDLLLTDGASAANEQGSAAAPFTVNTWHSIDVYIKENGADEDIEVFVDGSSVISVAAVDFGGIDTSPEFRTNVTDASEDNYFDNYAFYDVDSSADRLSSVGIKAYQSTDVGDTDQGDTLADGTWALVSETPGNAGTSNDAQYQDTGNLTGSTITDGGDRAGPSGDSDVSGATILAAKYLTNLKRSGGQARTFERLNGNNVDGVTATATVLTADYTIYTTISELASIVPTASEYFQQGFSKSATAGQDIFCGDQWAMLGYVPAAGAPTGEGDLDAANANVAGDGLAAHLGEGDLDSAAATLDGEGTVKFTGEGDLDAAAATLAGEGASQSVGEGALDSAVATLAGEGVLTIAGEGDLDSAAATAAGEGTSASTGEGDLAAAASAVVGEGVLTIAGEGDLAAAVATLEGSGAVGVKFGEGDLDAAAAAVAGEGTSASAGEGDLDAAVATVAGEGTSTSVGEGALADTVATMAGVGKVSYAGQGDLDAAAAAVSGEGLSKSTGEGALAAAVATAAGSGLSLSEAEGALAAAVATVAGEGTSNVSGQGSMQASTFTVAGAGLSISKGQGNLASAVANINGQGLSKSIGDGALSSSAATLAGTGRVAWLGVGSLDAVAAALSGDGISKSVGEGNLAVQISTVSGEGQGADAVSGTSHVYRKHTRLRARKRAA